MGKPFTIQESDEKIIDELKEYFGAPSKIAVVRMGLALLELEREKKEKIKQWEKAVKVVRKTSKETNKDFRKGTSVSKRVS